MNSTKRFDSPLEVEMRCSCPAPRRVNDLQLQLLAFLTSVSRALTCCLFLSSSVRSGLCGCQIISVLWIRAAHRNYGCRVLPWKRPWLINRYIWSKATNQRFCSLSWALCAGSICLSAALRLSLCLTPPQIRPLILLWTNQKLSSYSLRKTCTIATLICLPYMLYSLLN